ncbi:MAG: glycosyltransferase [Alphaproteobacteria bacterium]|nr:glycosyltransferase [Alphaproteobacteria bacterium]
MSAPKPTPDAGLSAALPRDLAEVLDQAANLAATGRLGAAQRKLEGALRRHEGAPLLHALLARVLEANRHTARALHHLRRAAALAPADPAPLLNLIRLHGEAGQLDRARDLARTATSQFPANAIFLFQLSVAEMRADDTAASKANLEAALAIDPGHCLSLYNLATILDGERHWDRAVALYRRARAADHAGVLEPFNSGSIELRIGEVAAAIASEEAWLRLHPADAVVWSNRLMAAQYLPGVTSQNLLAQHRAWQHGIADRLKLAPPPPVPTLAEAGRPLRVGLVSADFRVHPTAIFSIGAVERIDRAAVTLVAYDCAPTDDVMARRLRAAVPEWRDVADLPDDALLRLVREDRIDILLDLSGHISGNRLAVFARRAAPVQASWAGYVGTTGLDAMDWLIADRHLVLDTDEQWMAERVLRLPDAYVCFEPPAAAPDVTPLPAGDDRPLTFAAFHNPAKINDEVVALWARVLHAQTGATLRFVYDGYHLPGVQARLCAIFAVHGIEADRLSFTGSVSPQQMLEAYCATDICLDPFPYGGGLTTCEALWMGVPVVTLPGRSFAGRHAQSHLAAAGVSGTVARDADDYVAIVTALGADRQALQQLRAGLRARVASSPLCNAQRFAGHFADGLRHMWQEACAKSPG